jgi:hypothetical protein
MNDILVDFDGEFEVEDVCEDPIDGETYPVEDIGDEEVDYESERGVDGATFTPHITKEELSDGTRLTIEYCNDGSRPNPPPTTVFLPNGKAGQDGGVTDYEELSGLPSLNGIELKGNREVAETPLTNIEIEGLLGGLI